MKNLINCDYERTMNKIQDAENAHNKKKMPYDRLLTVKATGKYSSKQSDTNMKISTARYNRRRMNNIALKQAFETTIYFLIIWFPMELFICGKILFCKKDMNWGKTAHGLVVEEQNRQELEMQEV